MFTTLLKTVKQRPVISLAQKSAATFSSSALSSKPWEESKILLTGCQGQIGVPLVRALCEELGASNVVASDATD